MCSSCYIWNVQSFELQGGCLQNAWLLLLLIKKYCGVGQMLSAVQDVAEENKDLVRKYHKEMKLRKKYHNELVELKGRRTANDVTTKRRIVPHDICHETHFRWGGGGGVRVLSVLFSLSRGWFLLLCTNTLPCYVSFLVSFPGSWYQLYVFIAATWYRPSYSSHMV